MSAVKYDGYTDYRAGIRFIESLASWLNQFPQEHREAAYGFVKNRLIYVSPAEIQQIIEAFYAEEVSPRLREAVAKRHDISSYEVWCTKETAIEYEIQKRKTLFIGMSDGSRIDILRRINSGTLTTEQVLPMMNVDDEKWRDLQKNLDEDKIFRDGDERKFDRVYLIDDFTASGTTFIRSVDGEWKGKLKKFNEIVRQARCHMKSEEFPLAENFSLHIHHYITSSQAAKALDQRLKEADEQWEERAYSEATLSHGLVLPESVVLREPGDAEILHLCDTHYDHWIFKDYEKHCRQAGQEDMKRGYADCALPIVLDHNTPNNSVPLIWADTDDDVRELARDTDKKMRPLFRRRQRHG